MVPREGAAQDCDRSLLIAALGKYSSSMQQASLGGSHFAERAANILDDESAFKMLSRSFLCSITFLQACMVYLPCFRFSVALPDDVN